LVMANVAMSHDFVTVNVVTSHDSTPGNVATLCDARETASDVTVTYAYDVTLDCETETTISSTLSTLTGDFLIYNIQYPSLPSPQF